MKCVGLEAIMGEMRKLNGFDWETYVIEATSNI